ncbi:MAG: hypothetical protein R2861_05560 [Desulfobacterales bacterium]
MPPALCGFSSRWLEPEPYHGGDDHRILALPVRQPFKINCQNLKEDDLIREIIQTRRLYTLIRETTPTHDIAPGGYR